LHTVAPVPDAYEPLTQDPQLYTTADALDWNVPSSHQTQLRSEVSESSRLYCSRRRMSTGPVLTVD